MALSYFSISSLPSANSFKTLSRIFSLSPLNLSLREVYASSLACSIGLYGIYDRLEYPFTKVSKKVYNFLKTDGIISLFIPVFSIQVELVFMIFTTFWKFSISIGAFFLCESNLALASSKAVLSSALFTFWASYYPSNLSLVLSISFFSLAASFPN